MKTSSLKAFKQAGNHVIPQEVLHRILGGTETSSSSTDEATDPIPPATTHTDPPPPPKTTIYRIDGEFVY